MLYELGSSGNNNASIFLCFILNVALDEKAVCSLPPVFEYLRDRCLQHYSDSVPDPLEGDGKPPLKVTEAMLDLISDWKIHIMLLYCYFENDITMESLAYQNTSYALNSIPISSIVL